MIQLVIESTMSPNMQIKDSQKSINKSTQDGLRNFELGKRYPDFYMLEPFIDEYDTDLSKLEIGDIIIRDWQYGHLPNTGYYPLEVVEAFNGNSIVVTNTQNTYSICTDPVITKNTYWHKLDKNYCIR